MPELPEVEMARRAAARVAVGRRVVAVRCADDPL
ncbi:MAG: DNA-formamidopyrimidine glycosylase family protein, partial [Candidatus Rokuibacteriota bacterium]